MAGLETRIESVANGPKRVVGDGITVEQPDIDDLIKADKHLASKAAGRGNSVKGIKFVKMRSPAAI